MHASAYDLCYVGRMNKQSHRTAKLLPIFDNAEPMKQTPTSLSSQVSYSRGNVSPPPHGATGVFRVATECGNGPTKGSEFPLTTEGKRGEGPYSLPRMMFTRAVTSAMVMVVSPFTSATTAL